MYETRNPESLDELIGLVTSTAGTSTGQAEEAIFVVLTFLIERIPPPFEDQIDSLFSVKN